MAEIDVLKAQLVRKDAGAPWGFRLQGGAEFDRPITIMSVRPGSPADKIGLRAGDEVTEIGDTQTTNLTSKDAADIIQQYGLSLILTVERRARGAIPSNPVVSHGSQQPQLKHYQPYDLSGAKPAPRHPPQPQNYEFHTASARPYEPPPTPYAPPPPSHNNYESSGGGHHMNYAPDDDADDSHQSRTFKILQSLMQNEDLGRVGGCSIAPIHSDLLRADDDIPAGNPHQSRTFRMLQDMVGEEEPYAGSAGLPPPRSAAMERQRVTGASQQNPARVKVFMPQQYNTPLSMYSAENIMDTFQGQAEAQLETYDDPQRNLSPSMSAAQQAVMEQDRVGSEF